MKEAIILGKDDNYRKKIICYKNILILNSAVTNENFTNNLKCTVQRPLYILYTLTEYNRSYLINFIYIYIKIANLHYCIKNLESCAGFQPSKLCLLSRGLDN